MASSPCIRIRRFYVAAPRKRPFSTHANLHFSQNRPQRSCALKYLALYRLTALSQQAMSMFTKSPERTAVRISSPAIGTTRISSRLPCSISLVTVSLNPFQEMRKPKVHLWLRFSSLARKTINSFLPHLLVQFLHSARIRAPSRRKRGSSLPFTTEISISSVSVRKRPVTVKPATDANNLLQSSSSVQPLSSAEAAFSTASTSASSDSDPHPDSRAAISAIRCPTSLAACSATSSTSVATLRIAS